MLSFSHNAEPQSKNISVVIPWCDRPEISQTLHENRALLEEFAATVLIVNCGGDHQNLKAITEGFPVVDAGKANFNKSLALNLGVHQTLSSTVLLLDCDIILARSFFTEGLTALPSSAACVLKEVRESAASIAEVAHATNFEIEHAITIRHGDASASLITNRADPIKQTRSGLGIALIDRHDFLAVGGLNSVLSSWGWEDADLLLRLQFFARRPVVYVGAGVHLSHGDEVRSLYGKSREECETENYLQCLAEYLEGNLQGTYKRDTDRSSTVPHLG